MNRVGPLPCWLVAAAIGCGGPGLDPVEPVEDERSPPVVEKPPPRARRPPRLDPPDGPALAVGDPFPSMPPAPCDDPSWPAQELDLNGDGVVDVRRQYASGDQGSLWLVCKLIDFDYDQRFDSVSVFDADGTVRVEYFDFDFDGLIDAAGVRDPDTGITTWSRDRDFDGVIDVVEGSAAGH